MGRTSHWQERLAARPTDGPAWLEPLREQAIAEFNARGFPTMRDEAWRFTRVAPVASRTFEPAPADPPMDVESLVEELAFDDADCVRAVVVDGRFSAAHSKIDGLPAGARVTSLAEAIRSDDDRVARHLGRVVPSAASAFAALNTALAVDGVVVLLDEGVVLDRPVHLVFVATGTGTDAHPRALVVAGRAASATIVESWIGSGSDYLTNAVVEIVAGENACIAHTRFQHEAADAYHFGVQNALIGRDAVFTSENVAFGGALVRTEITAHLDGTGVDCRLDGLYVGRERQHIDNQTYIRHASPRCQSFELYKGILSDRARGVFNGRIYVDPHAQKTDAKQQNACILLSDGARIHTNPQLEIFADDVRCTHGATVGQLDREAVFYLRTRGIPGEDARHMLVHAFAAEVVERIPVEKLRKRIEVELFWWLSKTMATA